MRRKRQRATGSSAGRGAAESRAAEIRAARVARERALDPHRLLPLRTPEGVELRFQLAGVGDRALGFLLDTIFGLGAAVVLVLLTALATTGDSNWIWAAVLVLVFVLQHFYFIYFEAGPRGATPGKRITGSRVISADGGLLTVPAVVVRNLMRMLEFYLPLAALAMPQQFWPGLPAWAQLLAGAWLLVLVFLPLFNRNRQRVGDLVAGTLVVSEPDAMLLDDLGRAPSARTAQRTPQFAFSTEQLAVYGEYELQVLEEVLRGDGVRDAKEEGVRAVALQIAQKIRYLQPVRRGTERVFLLEFYAAQRARLEERRLFGQRKADKYEASTTRPPRPTRRP